MSFISFYYLSFLWQSAYWVHPCNLYDCMMIQAGTQPETQMFGVKLVEAHPFSRIYRSYQQIGKLDGLQA